MVLEIEPIEDKVYQLVRKEITTGVRTPGSRMRLSDLAKELGVSTMPVRSALGRLKSDGLVVSAPRRGTVVAPLLLSDLVDIQVVRMGLEGIAARRGAVALQPSDIKTISETFQQLKTLVSQPSFTMEEYFSLTRRIHETCYAAAGSARLLDLIVTYRGAAERYLRLALKHPEALLTDVRNQGRFVRACCRHNGAQAEEMARALLQWTVDNVAPELSGSSSAELQSRKAARLPSASSEGS